MSKSCDSGREMNRGWRSMRQRFPNKLPLASGLEPSPSGKRELMVLADDNQDMRNYLTRLLRERFDVHLGC